MTSMTVLPSPAVDVVGVTDGSGLAGVGIGAVPTLRAVASPAPAPARGSLIPLADVLAVLVAVAALGAVARPPVLLAVLLAGTWLVLVRVVERPPSPVSALPDLAASVARATTVLGLTCWMLSAFAPQVAEPTALVRFTVVAGALTLAGRSLALARRGSGPLATVVVGASEEAGETFDSLVELSGDRLTPVAACRPHQLAATVRNVQPHAVLAVPSKGFSGRAIQRLTWELEEAGIPLLVVTGLGDIARRRCGATRVGTMNLLHVSAAPRHGFRRFAKELWERAAAVVALLALLPVFAALVVVIRLDSRGPAFFRQTRVGRLGEHFTMWKFRSMRTDAEDLRRDLDSDFDAVLFKNRQDPRVTRVGAFLRRYSIDELPQLINVATGQMALIGPRPALPSEVAEYDDDMHRRLAVKPGITGLWQVSGRSDLAWQETVRLDLDYVDNWSFDRDLGILARTVRAVLSHRGAY